jgi:pimeloyl-ACP methyl ester carboxylesterase
MPLIFVFDPHGNGHLAVSRFSDGVTGFGYLVAGSNVIRNGYPAVEEALNTFVGDVYNRFPVDRQRVYAAGFSGGGRIAQLFSQLNPDVKALASVGAGYSLSPASPPAHKASMLFLTGNEDFNYLEVTRSQHALKAAQVHFHIIEYPGKHEWPAGEIMQNILLWFEFDAYRRNSRIKNDAVIHDFLNAIKKNGQYRLDKDDFAGALGEYEKGIAYLSGITHTPALQKKVRLLKKSPACQQDQKARQEAILMETRLQQGYISAFQEKDTFWWRKEINSLEDKINHPDKDYLRPVYKRIKGYLSMAAYSFCNHALGGPDTENAERYIDIYQIIDPGNPDSFYFRALYSARTGRTELAASLYKQAQAMGFNDVGKAQKELPEEVIIKGISK